MNPLIAKLSKQIEDATAEQKTILDAAAKENRDLNEEESKRFDELAASNARDRAAVEAAQKRDREIEGNRLWLQESNRQPLNQREHPVIETTSLEAIRVPATQKRHSRLQAFRGPDAERNAYLSGLWVAGCFYRHGPSLAKLREFGMEPVAATMTSTSNANGGYFVPTVMDTAVIELTEEYGVIRRFADNVPMSSDKWTCPKWTTGMTAYWVSHGQAPSQSEPAWAQVELVAKDLATYGKMTVQLNEDALVDLGEKWAMAAAIAFAYAEDNAAFNGDGTSTYGGVVGLLTKLADAANAASLSTATGHTTLAALTLGDYWAAVGKLPRYPGISPRWYVHQEVYAASMGPLQTAAGGVTPSDIAGGGIPRFLGYPVEFVNVMPAAASVTSGVTGIILADLSLSSKFGDRRTRTMRVGEINDDMIKQLMTLFTAERIDIVNHTIVDPKNSSKAGPVVGLKVG